MIVCPTVLITYLFYSDNLLRVRLAVRKPGNPDSLGQEEPTAKCVVKDIELNWIGALRHFSTMFCYIWRSVSTAGGTQCSCEWTSNLPLATDNYLSWDSNPSGEGRVVSKRAALTSRPRRSLNDVESIATSYSRNLIIYYRLLLFPNHWRKSGVHDTCTVAKP